MKDAFAVRDDLRDHARGSSSENEVGWLVMTSSRKKRSVWEGYERRDIRKMIKSMERADFGPPFCPFCMRGRCSPCDFCHGCLAGSGAPHRWRGLRCTYAYGVVKKKITLLLSLFLPSFCSVFLADAAWGNPIALFVVFCFPISFSLFFRFSFLAL